MEFVFNGIDHTYTLDGRRLPSVTEIIRSNFGDPFNSKDWYMQRGKALHKAIELLCQNKLDWSSVHPEVLPRLKSFENFIKSTGFKVLENEVRRYSREFQFAGTVDAIIQVDEDDGLYLVDFKSSITPEVDIQLGGYSLLFRKTVRLMAVELGEENFKIRLVKNLTHAERLFMCCLQIHNFKLMRGE